MRWPVMWRASHECQLAAALLRVQKIEDDYRQRLAELEAKHAVQLAEADTANKRLEGRNNELSRRLDERPESPSANRLRTARQAASRILAAYHTEKRRADHLQTRMDQAMGLDAPAIRHRREPRPERVEGVTAS